MKVSNFFKSEYTHELSKMSLYTLKMEKKRVEWLIDRDGIDATLEYMLDSINCRISI